MSEPITDLRYWWTRDQLAALEREELIDLAYDLSRVCLRKSQLIDHLVGAFHLNLRGQPQQDGKETDQ